MAVPMALATEHRMLTSSRYNDCSRVDHHPQHNSRPCSACADHYHHQYNSTQIQHPRQCHMHDQYQSNCHACNTPPLLPSSTSDTDSAQRQPYQNCKCYTCQKRRGEPVLHPLIGLSLGMATGGLSCAAMGIYRSVALHRRAKKGRKAAGMVQDSDVAQPRSLQGPVTEMAVEHGSQNRPFGRNGGCGYALPSPISALTCGTALSPTTRSEMEGSSPVGVGWRHASLPVSELDGSPVEAAPPPRYWEVAGDGMRVGVGEKDGAF